MPYDANFYRLPIGIQPSGYFQKFLFAEYQLEDALLSGTVTDYHSTGGVECAFKCFQHLSLVLGVKIASEMFSLCVKNQDAWHARYLVRHRDEVWVNASAFPSLASSTSPRWRAATRCHHCNALSFIKIIRKFLFQFAIKLLFKYLFKKT